MYVPTKTIINEITINRSRFIAIVEPLIDIESFKIFLDKAKRNYENATHYLYAYKVDNDIKSSDDKEPGNIAKGMLDLISKHDFNNILIIVVRYFGGVKLGASNLSRAYLNLVNDSLNMVERGVLTNLFKYNCRCDYSTFNKLKRLGYNLENVKYFDKIEVDIISKENILAKLKVFNLTITSTKEIKRIL